MGPNNCPQGGQPHQWSSHLCHGNQRVCCHQPTLHPQASIDEGEASLEDIPANISPIAAISGSGSTSPSMDLAELQTNANKALDDLLSTKGSIDARRWRAVWDLGMMLHQNESQVAKFVKEARVICCQTALDIWTACSQSILEARTSYLVGS